MFSYTSVYISLWFSISNTSRVISSVSFVLDLRMRRRLAYAKKKFEILLSALMRNIIGFIKKHIISDLSSKKKTKEPKAYKDDALFTQLCANNGCIVKVLWTKLHRQYNYERARAASERSLFNITGKNFTMSGPARPGPTRPETFFRGLYHSNHLIDSLAVFFIWSNFIPSTNYWTIPIYVGNP